jgi:DNA-damage-inducible protein D
MVREPLYHISSQSMVYGAIAPMPYCVIMVPMEKKGVVVSSGTIQSLDSCKHATRNGADYWFARDIQVMMGYTDWDNFRSTIDKARMSCESVGANPSQHFGDTTKMLVLGNGAKRNIKDIALTRYACYLVAMNGDPSKPEIAASQSYFASQTRKQELSEQAEQQHGRLALRDRVRVANKELNSAAKEAGVQNYAFFHDAGYMGLYGGLRLSEIKALKKIDRTEDLL